ncbi:MAG: hypothetical protein MJH10_17880 [Epibacterium sp.]|nr:hypothetical protein [Epibacterium sp.]NQX75365.1 hypothetical protein [Epibacterium sp.]
MKRSRFSEEQIIGILKEYQAGLNPKLQRSELAYLDSVAENIRFISALLT